MLVSIMAACMVVSMVVNPHRGGGQRDGDQYGHHGQHGGDQHGGGQRGGQDQSVLSMVVTCMVVTSMVVTRRVSNTSMMVASMVVKINLGGGQHCWSRSMFTEHGGQHGGQDPQSWWW